jgi:crotonobetainyl-CoA:carnitine CoA-transferase CaiB-like acyl-CoA transferase
VIRLADTLPPELFGTGAVEPAVELLNARHPGLDLHPATVLLGPDRPRTSHAAGGSAEGAAGGDAGRDPTSVNGRCRLLRTTDGWVAIQLAREEDERSVAAIVEAPVRSPWDALRRFAERSRSEEFVARARLLDVPAARLGEIKTTDPVAVVHRRRTSGSPRRPDGPIVDLSSMWAGPLCASIVGDATGRQVVDVESPRRPDPLRTAGDSFARRLHGGRELRSFDHTTVEGLGELTQTLAAASVVVTSGRPRALRSLALDPSAWVARRGGVWIHISGYGLASPLASAPAFGDDAAVAGGLVSGTGSEPSFLHDAVADPLTGLISSLIALAALADATTDPGCFIDVSMAATAALIAGNGSRGDALRIVEH